jgi:AcrR family transcriptional regulator
MFALTALFGEHGPVTSGLRERKKVATRLALHEAALRLVAERGADRVSIDDIAEQAGVSPRTFFNYFTSKDDALVGLDPDHATRLAADLAARPAGESAVQALRAVARAQATEMAEDPQLWPLRLQVVETNPTLVAKLAAAFSESDRVLATAIAERTGTRVDADALPMLLAGVAGAAMRTSLHRWFASDFTASLPDLVDEAWDAVAAGLPG